MKILYITKEHLMTVPMWKYIYEILIESGNEVIKLNIGRNYKGIGSFLIGSFKYIANRKIISIAKKEKPDVFFTLFGLDSDIFPETLEELKRLGILRVWWWLNDPFQFDNAIRNASNFDYFFTNAKYSVDKYKTCGIKNSFFLPSACHSPIHRKVELSEDDSKKYSSAVSFAGDYTPMREQFLLEVNKRFKPSIWGPWRKKLHHSSPLQNCLRGAFFTPAEMVKIFSASLITINLHAWYGRYSFGLNPRTFEAPACGVLTLTDFKDEIPMLFEFRYPTYKTKEELLELIEFYLDNPKERESVSSKLMNEMHANHTYSLRVSELMATIKEVR
jgi:spore maturation protein CgeB